MFQWEYKNKPKLHHIVQDKNKISLYLGTHINHKFQSYSHTKFLNIIKLKELDNDKKQSSYIVNENVHQNKEINKDIKTFFHWIYCAYVLYAFIYVSIK